MDVPDQVARDGLIVDAFVVERQHLLVKSIAEHVRNTTSYERSVLAGVWHLAIARAREAVCGDGLLGRASPLPGVPGAVVSKRMVVLTFEVSVGDIVLRGDLVGTVAACYARGGEVGALVTPMTVSRRATRHSLACSVPRGVEAWPCTEIQHCLAWKALSPDTWLVVCE